MTFYPSERLIELIEKSDDGELSKEEREELLLRCELETPSKSQSNISLFDLGNINGYKNFIYINKKASTGKEECENCEVLDKSVVKATAFKLSKSNQLAFCKKAITNQLI